VVDVEHRVVTAPAYMLAADIAELFKGIDAAVAEFLALIP
jgi:enhancing lycopene biosynthesis protein 2